MSMLSCNELDDTPPTMAINPYVPTGLGCGKRAFICESDQDVMESAAPSNVTELDPWAAPKQVPATVIVSPANVGFGVTVESEGDVQGIVVVVVALVVVVVDPVIVVVLVAGSTVVVVVLIVVEVVVVVG